MDNDYEVKGWFVWRWLFLLVISDGFYAIVHSLDRVAQAISSVPK